MMTVDSSQNQTGIENQYGGLLLMKCKEAIEKCPTDSPKENMIRDLVGWVIVESGFRANPEAVLDCLKDLTADSTNGTDDA